MSQLAALSATIPPPPFQNIEVGGVVLHGYGLTMGIAIITAIAVCEWGLRRLNVDPSRFTALAFVAVAAGFVGARLYHVASEPQKFLDAPGDIVKVWEGGLGIYGGVLGGAFVGLWLAPRLGIPRRAAADVAASGILVAQAIGRLGNYLNQELYGKPFDGAWALEVERDHRPTGYQSTATYHPTFLYEAIGTLTLAGIFALLLVRWRNRTPGILLPLYVAAYSVVRLVVEPLRIDEAHEWSGVRQNVWVAGALIVAGLAVALWMRHRDPIRRGH